MILPLASTNMDGATHSILLAGQLHIHTLLKLLLSIDYNFVLRTRPSTCVSLGGRVALDHSFGKFTALVPCLYFRYPGETFREAIKRHEHFIALQLGLKKGMKVSGEA
jgi:hypothetical protein